MWTTANLIRHKLLIFQISFSTRNALLSACVVETMNRENRVEFNKVLLHGVIDVPVNPCSKLCQGQDLPLYFANMLHSITAWWSYQSVWCEYQQCWLILQSTNMAPCSSFFFREPLILAASLNPNSSTARQSGTVWVGTYKAQTCILYS